MRQGMPVQEVAVFSRLWFCCTAGGRMGAWQAPASDTGIYGSTVGTEPGHTSYGPVLMAWMGSLTTEAARRRF